MVGVRARGEEIRRYILEIVGSHPDSVASIAAEKFGVTRQTIIANHISRLLDQGALTAEGTTRNRRYRLAEEQELLETLPLQSLEEDRVWRTLIEPRLSGLPDNVLDIWHYGFTEMLNNAIDHSEGESVTISMRKNPVSTRITITDDGLGIFRRIQQKLGLEDERHAILELSKGKLTTDPDNHSGEGIFFSSRVFDEYAILSGGVYFSHDYDKPEDWIMERNTPKDGTTVFMDLNNNSSRKVKAIFDEFASGDDYGFSKTVVPVSLARYGNERLVSRSQAKRLLAGVDRFKVVIFDFEGVERIGQAFADEVFRVFKNKNPTMQIQHSNTNKEVEQFILRAMTAD